MSETPTIDVADLIARLDGALKNGLHVTDLYVCDILREARAALVAQQEDGITLNQHTGKYEARSTTLAIFDSREAAEAFMQGQIPERHPLLLAQLREAKAQIDGDGSCSSDPLKSLGLRKCLELRRENIAQLEAQLRAAEARVDRAAEQVNAIRNAELQMLNSSRAATDEALARLIAACADEGHEGTQTHCSICRTLMEIRALRTGEGGGEGR